MESPISLPSYKSEVCGTGPSVCSLKSFKSGFKGFGPSQHLLCRLNLGQPRQEVQPHRLADHGKAEVRYLPLLGQGDVPLPR